jgi:ATP-dependent DNA ligase
VACDDNGLAMFERLRRKHDARAVVLYAFDLLELDGVELRREPIETRKAFHPFRRGRVSARLPDGA